MKRKVLCVFSLLLILLVFCTIVSPKAEEEMRTLAEAQKTFVARSGRNISIGKMATTWPNAENTFFNIIEGEGWENGLRIAVIPPTYYDRYEGHIAIGPGTDWWYIFSASREPSPGDAVTPVEEFIKGKDTYLFWFPEPVEDLDLLSDYSMTLLQSSDSAALADVRVGYFPYFEHRIWVQLSGHLGSGMRCFSLTDVQLLLNALPWIAGVITVLLCSLLLWGASWILLDKMGRRKGALYLNILLITGLFAALPGLLGRFDLPASLMPQATILDISHYSETFNRITTSMDSMGDPMVDNWLSQAASTSAIVIGSSVLLTAALVTTEGIICYRRTKEELEKSEE